MKVFSDLDGTLIDVSQRHYNVYSEVVHEFKGVPMDGTVYWSLKRKKVKWPELLKRSSIEVCLEQDFLAVFTNKIESPSNLETDKLFPSAIDFITKLHSDHTLYLVSLRRNRGNLLWQLDRLGISEYFRQILSGHSENDGFDKKIELIKPLLGSEAGAIVGDTEADVITGKELNLMTVAVTSGIRDESFLGGMYPDYIAKGLDDAYEFLSSR